MGNIRDKILIVEDELSIVRFMSNVILSSGYNVVKAMNGADALEMVESHCPDLIILDLGLPDMDGMEFLRKLREWSSIPVIVVSARTAESDKVDALNAGADDYITKPFGTQELLARIRTSLRHARTTAANREIAAEGTYSVGELVIDYDRHIVTLAGRDVGLTLIEFRIVALLGRYAGDVLQSAQHRRVIVAQHVQLHQHVVHGVEVEVGRKGPCGFPVFFH